MPTIIDGTLGLTTPTYGGADTSEYLVPVTQFKNRIINGAMVINQRATTVTPAGGEFYSVDRWAGNSTGSTRFSMQQSTVAPDGFINSLLITTTTSGTPASGDFCYFTQHIEGFNTADLGFGTANAKTVTLSFWIRSSLTGSFGGSIANSAGNRRYMFSFTISAANTWEYKTVTITGDTTGTWLTNNDRGISLSFNLGSGSSNEGTAGIWTTSGVAPTGSVDLVATNGATLYITGVQLEVGSTATSFDYRPYGTELQLCQRYYAKVGPSTSGIYPAFGTAGGESSTAAFGVFTTPVTMRSTPTFSSNGTPTLYSNGFSNITSFGAAYYTTNTVAININVSGGGLTAGRFYNILSNNDATSFVQFNSEL